MIGSVGFMVIVVTQAIWFARMVMSVGAAGARVAAGRPEGRT